MSRPAKGPSEETYDLGLIALSRRKWERSASLRALYGDLYREMARHAAPGPALELGSGAGTLKEFLPGVVTSDIRPTAFADRVVSAYAIDEASGGPWATLYLLDVLHHLRDPFRFFASAGAALEPGGRAVLCEPAATSFGRVFYRFFHHERMDPDRIPAPYTAAENPTDGLFENMAMAWALFVRDLDATSRRLRLVGLSVKHVGFRDVLAYPATGGFSRPALIPAAAVRGLLRVEAALPAAVLRVLALRMMVVLERV